MLDTNSLRPTQYPHIALTPQNVPIIEGTTMKVIEVVLAQRSYGWTAEEIQINHRYLSMGQIYAALAYYWDNRQALDQDIEHREDSIQKQERATGESAFATRLRSQGLLQ
ncbi:DUF433 domain-containing protein [cf. Phormidesmis sp. LEGE 11477]|uniref:DUF433 domain-containing protein n=1 Tax=cf. Phormidesmis sp. LEGE 11477 TaxID=1828680 RepID=UPI00187EDB35|nr:DUF433 domain-containing protein [cf. Phormidesmis sp. LEGE 11477]MBE9064507.1 DUF433 domain-containing protein [cf. Phormidesmis sp. LEGE 11477]